MRWRGTLALLAALAAAATWLYFDANAGRSERSWRAIFELPRPPLPGEQIKRLLAFEPADVTALTVDQHGVARTTRRLPDGRWSGVAQARDVDELLEDLAELAEVIPLEPDAAPLRDLGLDPPQATIEIARGNAAPLVLLVGQRNPSGTGVYARLGTDGPLVITGALVLWNLEKAARTLPTPAA